MYRFGVLIVALLTPASAFGQLRGLERGSVGAARAAAANQRSALAAREAAAKRYAEAKVVVALTPVRPTEADIVAELNQRMKQYKALQSSSSRTTREAVASFLADPKTIFRSRLPVAQIDNGMFGIPSLDRTFDGILTDVVFAVEQIIDDNNMVVSYDERYYWIAGTPTEGLVDGKTIRLANVVKVNGTASFNDAQGRKRTCYKLQAIDTTEADKRFVAQIVALPSATSKQ